MQSVKSVVPTLFYWMELHLAQGLTLQPHRCQIDTMVINYISFITKVKTKPPRGQPSTGAFPNFSKLFVPVKMARNLNAVSRPYGTKGHGIYCYTVFVCRGEANAFPASPVFGAVADKGEAR